MSAAQPWRSKLLVVWRPGPATKTPMTLTMRPAGPLGRDLLLHSNVLPSNHDRSRQSSYPLAPALRGEGWGEGSSLRNEASHANSDSVLSGRTELGCDRRTSANAIEEPLTLTLSPQGRGEGTGNSTSPTNPKSARHAVTWLTSRMRSHCVSEDSDAVAHTPKI